MGDYYEGRSRACWACAYFIQNTAEYRNGICVRHAPDKIDEVLGGGITGAPAGFAVFPNVVDPATGFCGEFIPGSVAPPAVIPPIQPES
jgi:hypothetical protein